MGLTEDKIVEIANYCYVTGSHTILTSLNMIDICDRFGFNKASTAIRRLYDFSTLSINTTESMRDLSVEYLNSKERIELIQCIFYYQSFICSI